MVWLPKRRGPIEQLNTGERVTLNQSWANHVDASVAHYNPDQVVENLSLPRVTAKSQASPLHVDPNPGIVLDHRRAIERCLGVLINLDARIVALDHCGGRVRIEAAYSLFFKFIKQHLRIKSFYGTSENAVKTQIWIAVSIYVLVAIVRKRLRLEVSFYQILQILSLTLFEKMPILRALEAIDSHNELGGDANQLILFEF